MPDFRKFIEEKLEDLKMIKNYENIPELKLFSNSFNCLNATKVKIETTFYEEENVLHDEVNFWMLDFLISMEKNFYQEIYEKEIVPSDSFLQKFMKNISETIAYCSKKLLENKLNFVAYSIVIVWKIILSFLDKLFFKQK